MEEYGYSETYGYEETVHFGDINPDLVTEFMDWVYEQSQVDMEVIQF